MIRAIFFDLDGTLLNRKKEISQQSRLALKKCKESGVRIFIATARPPLLDQMLTWDESTLSLFDGGSYYNGGCIAINGQKEYHPIHDDIVLKIIGSVCEHDQINIALQLEGERHAFRYPLEERGYKSWGLAAEEALSLKRVVDLKTIKMLIFYANLVDSVTPLPGELVESLKRICRGHAQFYLSDMGKCGQIVGESVNKMTGIEKIRMALGLEKDEIAVFGDDVNDVEMLSEYEHSVAMGNAERHVKDKAKYVTLDNDSEGIYHALHSILGLI